MDTIDKYLLEQLQASGRKTASDLADGVLMSVPAITERIRKLQESGVLTGFHAAVDPRKLGKDVGAIITVISESSAHFGEVVESAIKHAEVIQCLSVTGVGSHLLVVRTENSGTLEALLRQIQSWPGVTRTETRIILSSYKDRAVIEVAADLVDAS